MDQCGEAKRHTAYPVEGTGRLGRVAVRGRCCSPEAVKPFHAELVKSQKSQKIQKIQKWQVQIALGTRGGSNFLGSFTEKAAAEGKAPAPGEV